MNENFHHVSQLLPDGDMPRRLGAEDEPSFKTNSRGYRGPDYTEQADYRIAVFGAEEALGRGLEDRQTCHALVADHVSAALERSVLVWNFGTAGASSETITRLAAVSLRLLRPDLVLINFPPASRREHLRVDGEVFLFDPLRPPRSLVERELHAHFTALSSRAADLMNFYRNYISITGLLAETNWIYSVAEPWLLDEAGPEMCRERCAGMFHVPLNGAELIANHKAAAENFRNVWTRLTMQGSERC